MHTPNHTARLVEVASDRNPKEPAAVLEVPSNGVAMPALPARPVQRGTAPGAFLSVLLRALSTWHT
jgi:hypothetical protein